VSANLRTFSAAYASFVIDHKLRPEGLAFGVVAPNAGKGAAL